VIAAAAGVVAQVLTRLIGFVTDLAFYGSLSSAFVSPAANRLGPLVILVPIAGAVVVGLMARYGSAAIRGHGIPEAMEQVLLNKSRIPARVTVLKPVSAAISIGTGGPFGAEGPIIATVGITPAFEMPNIAQPGEAALAAYVLLGAVVGVAAVTVTKIVYAVEDAFDHLPIHWMWWPAIGAVAVGVCGYFAPHTLGVG